MELKEETKTLTLNVQVVLPKDACETYFDALPVVFPDKLPLLVGPFTESFIKSQFSISKNLFQLHETIDFKNEYSDSINDSNESETEKDTIKSMFQKLQTIFNGNTNETDNSVPFDEINDDEITNQLSELLGRVNR